jgi:DNA repair photolyase
MNIRYIKCKTALSNSKLPALNYSLNPYVGCQHNCAYCYAPNILKICREEWGNNIGVKYNIPKILSNELKKKKNGTIGISTVTDPYQPIEKKYKLTRFCLEQIKKYDFPIHIQTKSSIVNRDIDLISKISNVELMVSIATLNDNERKILEPFSSSIKERINILKNFSDIGIKTSVFFGPIYPTIKETELIKIINKFIVFNVKEIMLDHMHLKNGIWRNIELILDENPELKKKFLKEKFIDNSIISNIYKILNKLTKNNNIKISKAFY